MDIPVLAPGARVLIRDAEWLVRKVDRTATNRQAVSVVGLSQIVKDREAVFLDEIDQIELLNPEDTDLVADTSSFYRDSLLFMESLLRQTPPTDEHLYIGYQGAMDIVPYQLDPAIQALKQPRQRILMADAVGLGKTIEAGILLSELIRRGKGKRILVLTVKSMLTQFQKELWSRFTIPLTRLDSVGIQRVRSRIPTNHNPFYYFDRAIISIDTLKQDAEYRTYLEKCYWDIIVIDEAHNVAARGNDAASLSMRYRLANLLKHRSDTLIMLSATPHDGKPRAFASLMNMLNPTAIANPEDYGPDDIKGLFIRRFKKDIKDQVTKSFMERKISVSKCQASPQEEAAFDVFTWILCDWINGARPASSLKLHWKNPSFPVRRPACKPLGTGSQGWKKKKATRHPMTFSYSWNWPTASSILLPTTSVSTRNFYPSSRTLFTALAGQARIHGIVWSSLLNESKH